MNTAKRLLPNLITLMRAAAAVLFGLALLHYDIGVGLGLLAFAGLTDVLDGWLARRLGVCSAAGAYLDAAADGLMVGAGFIVLVARGVYPPWVLVLLGVMFAQFVLVTRGGKPVYDPVGKYYGAALYGVLLALLLVPDVLLSLALLAGVVGLSALSLGSRLLLAIRSAA
jgi:CDP-diacylglycerol--glycerol-3-phosphate 3-phosphatidyltransferase/cardiolipin synthase